MKRVAFLLTALTLSGGLQAKSVSWHGYVSQGLTQSKGSRFITDNDDITAELTELGINGRYDMNPSISLVGQLVYLDGGNRYDQGTRLDYLFVDWSLPEVAGWDPQLHIGRFKNRHWLYSATRDVPQTRATAVLPQSVYFDIFRDIALGSDGIQAQAKRFTDDSIWEVIWSYGRSELSDEQQDTLLSSLAQGEADQDFVHQFSVYWQPSDMSWRVGLSGLSSEFSYDAADADPILDGNVEVKRLMLSMQYFSENWEFSSEILREYQTYQGLFSTDFYQSGVGEGGYAQFRYLLNSDVSVLLSYDVYYPDRNDRDGTRLVEQSGGLLPDYLGYMRTRTVGFRWDIAPNWRFQAEHHWVNGTARAQSILNPVLSGHNQEAWRMWAAQLMYWF
ncbi:hypothetical protein [Alteromonas sp. CYL-A6]|uniref:hypothetical protein n=1 Tax=Alteromonas nitratireducens TaxID=3390813 RepID=UPI0034A7A5B7